MEALVEDSREPRAAEYLDCGEMWLKLKPTFSTRIKDHLQPLRVKRFSGEAACVSYISQPLEQPPKQL